MLLQNLCGIDFENNFLDIIFLGRIWIGYLSMIENKVGVARRTSPNNFSLSGLIHQNKTDWKSCFIKCLANR